MAALGHLADVDQLAFSAAWATADIDAADAQHHNEKATPLKNDSRAHCLEERN
jgi:hypothetical protein